MKKSIILSLAVLVAMTSCKTNENQPASEMENPVIEAIMSRQSIRHYLDKPVEREKLQKIAECGIQAPNAMNKQEWEVRIVDSQKYFSEVTDIMAGVMPFFVSKEDPKFRNAFRNASAIICIACPDDESGMCLQNVGLMSENICLAAQSLGLGTCVMGGPAMMLKTTPEAKPYLDALKFSDGYSLQIVIAVGYPDETPEKKPRDSSKIQFIDFE